MRYVNDIILCIAAAIALFCADAPAALEERTGEATQRKSLPRDERTMLARTLLSECGRCGDAEVKAIGWVIKNRLRSGRYGDEIGDVVLFQRRGVYAFTGWDPRYGRNEAIGAHVDRSRAYARMLRLADAVWQEEKDPTGNAVDYWHPASFKPRGGRPYWVKNRVAIKIGGALFYR